MTVTQFNIQHYDLQYRLFIILISILMYFNQRLKTNDVFE